MSTVDAAVDATTNVVRALIDEFLSLHQKRELPQVDAYTAATLNGRSDDDVSKNPPGVSPAPMSEVVSALEERFKRWHITFRVPSTIGDRSAARERLAGAVPPASMLDISAALIRAEMRGFAEADAQRLLEKQHNIARRRGQSFAATPKPPLEEVSGTQTTLTSLRPAQSVSRTPSPVPLVVTPTRPALAAVVLPQSGRTDPQQEDLKEWILALLNPEVIAAHSNLAPLAPLSEVVRASSNVVDTLRDGLLLTFLMQSLCAVAPSAIRLPKRVTGFYRRDNVTACLRDVASRFPQFHDTAMLDVGDIVVEDAAGPNDGAASLDDPRDRRVMTFLLNISKAALRGGQYNGPVPAFVQLDEEIDKEAATITEADITTACEEPEATPITTPARPCASVIVPEAAPESPPPLLQAHLGEGTSPHEPVKPHDAVVSKQEMNEAVAHIECTAASAQLTESPHHSAYVPCPGDAIDEEVGQLMNRTLQKFPGLSQVTQLKRLSRSGAYVMYHRITKKKTLVHIRAMRSTLMIRVGGGWDVLEHWLSRHAVDMLGKAAR